MNEQLKLVVLSDLHLQPNGATSYTLDTAERLRTAVRAINERHQDADLVLLAGDLTDLGEHEAYLRLQSIIAELKVPCLMTIGNHDDRATFLNVFGQDYAASTGFIDRAVDVKGQRIIVLDSAIEGTHAGYLAPEQLAWLRTQLDGAQDRPVIVVLHHHASPLHTMVDRIILRNGAELAAILRMHGDVRHVIAGHVHYTSTAIWHGLPFTTLAGNHYNVSIPLTGSDREVERLTGPGQMALVLSGNDQTLIHFENYIDEHQVIPNPSDV
ncbi:MAG: Icc protein [Paracoccaceae bacterium]|jgi:Icc protein